MMVGIVDETEGRHAAWLKTEVFQHSLSRGEAELAGGVEASGHKTLLEATLKVVDVHVMITVEAYEVVLVAFVVAEEEILAVDAAVILPPSLCFFYSLAFRMAVACVRYLVLVQPSEDGRGTFADVFHIYLDSFFVLQHE